MIRLVIFGREKIEYVGLITPIRWQGWDIAVRSGRRIILFLSIQYQ